MRYAARRVNGWDRNGDRFSLVEVREDDADAVVEALRRVKIRGRKVTASGYRPPRTRRTQVAGDPKNRLDLPRSPRVSSCVRSTEIPG